MDTQSDFDPEHPASDGASSHDDDEQLRGDEARLRAVPNISPRVSPDERLREILAELKGEPIVRPAPSMAVEPYMAPPVVVGTVTNTRRPRSVWIGAVVVLSIVIFGVVRVIGGNSDSSGHVNGVDDDFSVNLATLDGESTGGGPVWTLDGGAFVAQDGSVTSTSSALAPAFALLRFAATPSRISALVSSAGPGSGVVFRYVDSDNYWSVQAAPTFGTWNIYKVVAGRQTFVKNTANNFTKDTTIEVRITPQQLQISINNRPSALITDNTLSQGSTVGLLAGPGESHTTFWTRFVAVP